MKTRKIFVLLSVIALCAGGFAWREKQALSATRSSFETVNERVAAAQREVVRLRERLASLTEERGRLLQISGKNPLSTAQLPEPAKPPEKPTAVTPKDLAAMVQNLRERETSEGQRRQLAWHRARLGESYQSFVQSLGLSPAGVQRFEAALLRQEEEHLDIMAVAREHGLTLMDPTLGGLWNQAETEYQDSQKELLGEDGYRKLQDYERTVSVRDFVRGFIGVTTLAGRPLSSQQAEQLVGIFAATTESYAKGGKVPALFVDWDAGLKRAQEVISPEQLKLIATYEPQGGVGGIAWMRFNKMLNDAQHEDADRRAQNAQATHSASPQK